MSKFRFGKGLLIYAAISAVVIIAGIILCILLNFNYAAVASRRVEVTYDAVVTIAEKEDELDSMCEKVFSESGLSVSSKQTGVELDSQSLGETGGKAIVYSFSEGASENTLKNAAALIRQRAEGSFGDAQISVSVHSAEGSQFYEALWRGAIALGVAAIVALVYIGIRYGVACALTGLFAVLNDVLFTLGLFAIVRIPVYAYAPLLFAGLAAVLSIVFWTVQCFKLKENGKDPTFAALSAADAVDKSCKSSLKSVLLFAAPIAAAFAVIGAVATAGVRLFFLSALIPLAVALYSSLLLAPAILVPFKARFDRLKASRKRYTGKQKASAEEKVAAEE